MILTNTLEQSFTAVEKTDDRWYNQPDQTVKITDGSPNFYIRSEISSIMTNPNHYPITDVDNIQFVYVAGDQTEIFTGAVFYIYGSSYMDGEHELLDVTYESSEDRTRITTSNVLYGVAEGVCIPSNVQVVELDTPCDAVIIDYNINSTRVLKKTSLSVLPNTGLLVVQTYDSSIPPRSKWEANNFVYAPNTGAIQMYVNGHQWTNFLEVSSSIINVYVDYAGELDIVYTDPATNSFTISGDYTFNLSATIGFDVIGSTSGSNDGHYTVSSSTYNSELDQTIISVVEDVTSQPIEGGEIGNIEVLVIIVVNSGRLQVDVDYRMINSKTIEFLSLNYSDFGDVTIKMCNPATTRHNAAKLIDVQSGVVKTEIPFWDPARSQHYHHSLQMITVQNNQDPAVYENVLDGVFDEIILKSETFQSFPIADDMLADESDNILRRWDHREVNTVWWNTKNLNYIPYYDSHIFPELFDRIRYWGQLADWSSIELNEWTESPVLPNEWSTHVEEVASDPSIPNDQKPSGEPLTKLYVRTRVDPTENIWLDWEQEQPSIVHFNVSIINQDQQGTFDYKTFDTSSFTSDGDVINVYVNGVLNEELIVAGGNIVLSSAVPEASQITLIRPAHIPTDEELSFDPDVSDDGVTMVQYKKDTPYCTRKIIDPNEVTTTTLYYFWVTDKKTKPLTRVHSLRNASHHLTEIPIPYIHAQKFLPKQEHITDTGVTTIIPDRFSQVLLHNLQGIVNDSNRYIVRFPDDLSLRGDLRDDNQGQDSVLKNKHTEWVLFRERQNFNVPKVLWDKITEAMVGYSLTDPNIAIPSLDRVLYDVKYGTDTRFGLNDGQAITDPKLAIGTITDVIINPDYDISPLSKDTFLANSFDLTTNSGIISTMDYIYNSFNTKQVNDLFFSLLLDGLSVKNKMPNLFKTSWVSLQSTVVLDVNGRLANG